MNPANKYHIHFIVLGFLFFLLTQCQKESPIKFNDPWKGEIHFGTEILLNGEWEIAEGSMETIPDNFNRTIPVPGIIKNAVPGFEDAGSYLEQREAYWYKKTFNIPSQTGFDVARLIIKKARYGTKIYVNGLEAGENMLNFTPTEIDITQFLKKDTLNEVIVRLGAHIENAPDTVATAGEVEKQKYYAGIYDDVKIIYSQGAYIANTQVVPDIEREVATVIAEFKNPLETKQTFHISPKVFEYPKGFHAGSIKNIKVEINAAETKVIEFEIPIKNCKQWTPEQPNLYVLEISKGNKKYYTRFGMRTVKIDNRFMNKAMLNDTQFFLRGTNVSLFRFFEDTLCKMQPWDRQWVEDLHKRFKEINWNSYRVCITALPDFWYEIADEQGFVIFDEYPIWYALQNEFASEEQQKANLSHPHRKYGVYPSKLTADRLTNEYTQWMRDHWNHASVCFWDAQNETWTQATGEAINRVRDLDRSNRPWDNGWSPPAGENDYREAHNYYARYNAGTEAKIAINQVAKPFTLSDLPSKSKIGWTFYSPYQMNYENGKLNDYWEYPCVLNEYGYLWLNRDGTPTALTKPYYDVVLGENATPNDRFYHHARMLAAITEFWRSSRTVFGVLHVFGLSFSSDYAYTSDIFTNIDSLTLYPYFEQYVTDAFAPVGICIDFWEDKIKVGNKNNYRLDGFEIPLIITNDKNTFIEGKIELELKNTDSDSIADIRKYYVEVNALQQQRIQAKMLKPTKPGNYILTVKLVLENSDEVISYRDIYFHE